MTREPDCLHKMKSGTFLPRKNRLRPKYRPTLGLGLAASLLLQAELERDRPSTWAAVCRRMSKIRRGAMAVFGGAAI
jgi:hypothetical protein